MSKGEDMQNEENQVDSVPYRPLGIVKGTLEPLGVEITYVYEDLIFIKHNHFLLQFGEVGEKIFFFRNCEIEIDKARGQFTILSTSLSGEGLELIYQGSYRLEEKDDGTMSLEFHDENPEEQ
jgi:hypothetical protein